MRRAALPILLAGVVGFGASASAGTDTTTADTAAADTTAGTTGDSTTGTEAGATAGTIPSECGPDADVWKEPGTLTAATGEPAYPPYVIDDDPSTGEGFEAAVVYAVAETLGFPEDGVTWVRTTFEEAIAPGEKDYDFNIQQYGITAERDEIVDFSTSYYDDQKVLLAPGESAAAGASTFADLAELKFGATIGTTDYDYIVDVIGIPEDDVSVYNDQAATFAALDAGQIDATVIGLPTALYITGVEMPQIAIVGSLPRQGGEATTAETDATTAGTATEGTATEGTAADTEGVGEALGMGMLFEEGNPARDCVNAALAILDADGTLTALDEQWMQGGGEIPEITE